MNARRGFHIHPHPTLHVAAWIATFPQPLAVMPAAEHARALFGPKALAKVEPPPGVVADIRDMLRVGGFKPRGRNKPASEYLLKARKKGWFTPQKGINPAVDICNAVSMHCALPISVVDVERTKGLHWHIRCSDEGTSYVFNPSGQRIDVCGLVCLHDEEGPFASPVKDAQRTKTHDNTLHTLYIVWGARGLEAHTHCTALWAQELLSEVGAILSRPRSSADGWVLFEAPSTGLNSV